MKKKKLKHKVKLKEKEELSNTKLVRSNDVTQSPGPDNTETIWSLGNHIDDTLTGNDHTVNKINIKETFKS